MSETNNVDEGVAVVGEKGRVGIEKWRVASIGSTMSNCPISSCCRSFLTTPSTRDRRVVNYACRWLEVLVIFLIKVVIGGGGSGAIADAPRRGSGRARRVWPLFAASIIGIQ